MTRQKIVSLEPVNYETATGRAKEVLDPIKKQMGMIPNMYLNMANVPAVLDMYLKGYAAFRSEGGFSSQEQEVVFLAINYVNHCEYCMGAHSWIADKQSGVPADVLQAIRTGNEIPDVKLAALDKFTRAMVKTAGNPSKDDIALFHEAGYEDKDILSIVLALSVKVLSNYTNHLFATEIDSVFADYRWPE